MEYLDLNTVIYIICINSPTLKDSISIICNLKEGYLIDGQNRVGYFEYIKSPIYDKEEYKKYLLKTLKEIVEENLS